MATALEGLRVKYSVSAGNYSTGIVLDQISRTEKTNSELIVSAYSIIDDSTLQIVHPTYWRILGCINQGGHFCSLADAMKEKIERENALYQY